MHFTMSTEKLSGRGKDMVPLADDFVPGPGHVICAKGKQAKQHPANRMLKNLVQSKLKEYSECPSKLERSFIVSAILKTIRQNGGFVRNINGKWFDIGDRNSKEKIGQLFRDNLSHMFKSSTKAKASIRRQKRNSSGDSASGSSNDSDKNESPPQRAKSTYTFPISEVTIDTSAPQPDAAKSNGKQYTMEVSDLEPIPLADATVAQFGSMEYDTSSSAVSSNASSFDSSMHDLYSHLSCSVLSSTTANTMASSQFNNSAFQQQQANNANVAMDNQQQQSLLSSLQVQSGVALPSPYALRAQLALSGHFSNYQNNNTSPLSIDQSNFLLSSLQAPSSAMLPESLEPTPIAPTSTHLLARQQQLQRQQQHQQQQQSSTNTTNSAAGDSNTEEEQCAQSSLKAQWKRQFE
ncbi:Nitrilase family, member 2 [Seminavis robusta]|uniref:Nitrilase family, member 2 n=1 Tax=Seminavis robusta TaxID=568900 RepID=A0A9N8HNF4_9STRA|nr:Nitrilase family, member 2 [Seminavis robusta]|eukprot:Sro1206_g252350.1 Nitrilase family, member 2 (407) ;mRNA; r:9173-10393